MGLNLIGKGGCGFHPHRDSHLYLSSRIQVAVAKIQQSIPEMKRDGSNVLSSLWATLMHTEKSTSSHAGVLPQSEIIPKLAKALQETPKEVIADFEEIRRHSRHLVMINSLQSY